MPEKFNISTHTIKQYSNSEFLQKIKQSFERNEWPQGCERCRIEEANGVESKRILDYTRWKEHYDRYQPEQGFITASVAFGNTCNLKCITCSPVSSSLWQKEHKDLFGSDIKHFRFYKNDFVEDFVRQAPNLIHIDVPGGEPFLSGISEQKQLLQQFISSGQAPNVSIHYTTNATIFPDSEWWELWKHFKEIDMQLSIDGIGKHHEYIRFPGNWFTVLENVNRYVSVQQPNFRLSVSHTLSAYNVFYLDEFFTWCYNQTLPTPWVGRVHMPEAMRPTVWPEPIRQIISNKLSTSAHPEVRTWAQLVLNENDSEFFEEFKHRVQQHDEYRGINFADTFTELSQYL